MAPEKPKSPPSEVTATTVERSSRFASPASCIHRWQTKVRQHRDTIPASAPGRRVGSIAGVEIARRNDEHVRRRLLAPDAVRRPEVSSRSSEIGNCRTRARRFDQAPCRRVGQRIVAHDQGRAVPGGHRRHRRVERQIEHPHQEPMRIVVLIVRQSYVGVVGSIAGAAAGA